MLSTLPVGRPTTTLTAAPRRGRRLLAALTALVVLLVAGAVALALVVRSHRADRDALQQARSEALLAGRQLLLNLDAISANTVDKDLQRVVAGSTGDFRDSFAKAQADLKKLIVSNGTSSSGQILAAGVVRSDSDSASVLVAVDRRVKDKTNPAGAVAHDRWQVALEKHGGHWLVADLQPVS